MKYRNFGRQAGLRVSQVALGAANFGNFNGRGPDPSLARNIFEKYLNLGGNFIDTSELYNAGQSEMTLATLMKDNRDKLVLSSKYTPGVTMQEGVSAIGNSRKSIVRAIEGTLKRLRTDHVDLYWVHLEDRLTPTEEILRALDDLSRAGKILYAGISNFPAWKISRATAIAELKNSAPIVGVQFEYNLFERNADRELLPMAEALGLGVMIYSPLAHGKLTKSETPAESDRGRQAERIRAVVLKISNELGWSSSEVAVAWIYAKANASSTSLIPILGASQPEQIEANINALDKLLSADHLAQLETASQIELGNPYDVVSRSLPIFSGGNVDSIIKLPTPFA